jgi:hypothetical protein
MDFWWNTPATPAKWQFLGGFFSPNRKILELRENENISAVQIRSCRWRFGNSRLYGSGANQAESDGGSPGGTYSGE